MAAIHSSAMNSNVPRNDALNAPGARGGTATSGAQRIGKAASATTIEVVAKATRGPKVISIQLVRSGLAMPTTAAMASRAPI